MNMMTSDSIARRPLHEELAERLRDLISLGELQPGEKIPEKALCERFGVSRTPLREALKVLASAGTVTLRPNRGAVVSTLTREELDEVFPVMGSLEALAGKSLARKSPTSRSRVSASCMSRWWTIGATKSFSPISGPTRQSTRRSWMRPETRP